MLNILLVEDDDGDAGAVRRGFRKVSTVNIQRAVNGIEALEMLKGENGQTKTPRHVLLIVDLNMPKMSGVELVKAMRMDDQLKQAVIFILTTSTSEEDKRSAYDLNVAGYIDKATAGREFLNLVELMNSYRTIVQLP
jgi:DNA-binding response OmpR family regulator